MQGRTRNASNFGQMRGEGMERKQTRLNPRHVRDFLLSMPFPSRTCYVVVSVEGGRESEINQNKRDYPC